jgi:hypothetical protein
VFAFGLSSTVMLFSIVTSVDSHVHDNGLRSRLLLCRLLRALEANVEEHVVVFAASVVHDGEGRDRFGLGDQHRERFRHAQ